MLSRGSHILPAVIFSHSQFWPVAANLSQLEHSHSQGCPVAVSFFQCCLVAVTFSQLEHSHILSSVSRSYFLPAGTLRLSVLSSRSYSHLSGALTLSVLSSGSKSLIAVTLILPVTCQCFLYGMKHYPFQKTMSAVADDLFQLELSQALNAVQWHPLSPFSNTLTLSRASQLWLLNGTVLTVTGSSRDQSRSVT